LAGIFFLRTDGRNAVKEASALCTAAVAELDEVGAVVGAADKVLGAVGNNEASDGVGSGAVNACEG
jgi:hypothetical protein